MSLSEKEVRRLMNTDAYTNRNNKNYEKVNREVRQGFENLYPDDDRNENPENYYVWRTKGDDRVRGKHAERDGEVFSWDNPPDGGHPGEDYNCRCWAEKYVPPKVEKWEKDGTGSAETEKYMSFGDRALSAMSGIFGISEAKAKEPEIDAITSASKPSVDNLLELEKPKKDDYLVFDGFRLTWYRNDKPLKSWKAMSGNADPKYQKKSNQGLSNYGPLPEGLWNVKQSEYQSVEDEQYDNYRAELRNKTANLLDVTNRSVGKFLNKAGIISGNKLINKKFGNWSGGYDSWGDYRIWLHPAKGTDAKNRSGLAIHGGATYGSDGCIDLATKVDEFMKMYRVYGKDMKLIVKYADDFPE